MPSDGAHCSCLATPGQRGGEAFPLGSWQSCLPRAWMSQHASPFLLTPVSNSLFSQVEANRRLV